MVAYYTRNGAPLPYDAWKTHIVPLADIKAAAEHYGIKFRHGDNLILRMGWTHVRPPSLSAVA